MEYRYIILVVVAVLAVTGVITAVTGTSTPRRFGPGLQVEFTRFPVNTSEMLHRVDIGPGGDAWAVGHHGSLLHWNGTTWQQEAHLSSRQWAVHATRPSSVWIGGYAPQMLSRWNGSTLRDLGLNEQYPGIHLYDFAASGNNTIWAVGGAFRDRQQGSGFGFVLRYNGTHWRKMPAPPGRMDVFFMAVEVVNGSVYAIGGGELSQPTHLVRWDGSQWHDIIGPLPDTAFHSLHEGANDSVWAVGDAIIQVQDGDIVERLNPPEIINSLTPLCDGFLGVGQGSTVVYWDDNTARYTKLTRLPHPTDLVGIATIGPGTVWITGGEGTVLRGEIDCAE